MNYLLIFAYLFLYSIVKKKTPYLHCLFVMWTLRISLHNTTSENKQIFISYLQSQNIYTKYNLTKNFTTPFNFGAWVLKKIRKPQPPIQIFGEPWLATNLSEKCHNLTFEYVVESLTDEEYNEADKDTPTRNTKIPIQALDGILHENTHQIKLTNISNIYIFNKLNLFFNFDKLTKISVPTVRKEIAALINRLKFSGYFSKINIIYNTHKKTATFTVNMELNPILKEIKFIEYDNILIPYSTLHELSLKQINFPKSLAQLNLLTHKIQHWYSCRGYNWVHVQGIGEQFNSESATLKIVEGIIDKITCDLCLLVDHTVEKSTPLNKFVPTQFIKDLIRLHLYQGQIPTIYAIEKAMRAIKETRFFYNSYYDIKFPQNSHKIEIIIFFVPARDSEIHGVLDKIVKKIGSFDKMEEQIQSIIKNLSKGRQTLTQDRFFYNQLNDLVTPRTLAIKFIYGTNIKYILDHIFFNVDIKNSPLGVELGVDENFELHQQHSKLYFSHNIRYIGQKYDFANFTFKEEDYVPQYDFSYDVPLNINKLTFYPLASRIFSNLTYVKRDKEQLLLNSFIKKKKLLINSSEFRRKGLEFVFQRKFVKGTNCSSTLGNRLITYYNLKHRRESALLNYIQSKFRKWGAYSSTTVNFAKSNLKRDFITQKELEAQMNQNFKIWSLKIQVPNVDDIYHPTIGSFTQLDFIQFRSNYDLIKTVAYPNYWRTSCLYFLKQIFYFRTRPKYSFSPFHLLIFKTFWGGITGNKLLFSLPDRLRYQKQSTNQSSGFNAFDTQPTKFGEHFVEYHLRLFKYTNPVVFMKLIHDSPLIEEYPFPHIQGELFYSKRLDLSPISTGMYVGVAWEFRTMITQIPPVRIEFVQKILGDRKIYLRVVPYLY